MAKPLPDIYHITHVDNLAGIVKAGGLWCDAKRRAGACRAKEIGYQHIKDRRTRRRVPVGPGGVLADYVPFYFCPRSVMLYVISRGRVEGHEGRDVPVIHLVANVAPMLLLPGEWAFTNRHAEPVEAEYYADLGGFERIRWDIIESNSWGGDDRRPFKQAEFLIHEFCPWELIDRIGVWGPEQAAAVEKVLQGAKHRPIVEVQRDWYYTEG